MNWHTEGSTHVAHTKRGDVLVVRELAPTCSQWTAMLANNRTLSGECVSLFVAKHRAEYALVPNRRTTASFTVMRQTMVHDVGTSEPFWYERLNTA